MESNEHVTQGEHETASRMDLDGVEGTVEAVGMLGESSVEGLGTTGEEGVGVEPSGIMELEELEQTGAADESMSAMVQVDTPTMSPKHETEGSPELEEDNKTPMVIEEDMSNKQECHDDRVETQVDESSGNAALDESEALRSEWTCGHCHQSCLLR